MMAALNFENEVLQGYITWGGIILIKMMLMSFLTGINRFRKGAFENPEDVRGRENVEIKKDEDVERVRRAHLNDLENIPAFLLAGFFYVLSEPQVDLALWLFRIAVLARIGHTIVSSIIDQINSKIIVKFSYLGLCCLSSSTTSAWNLLHDLFIHYGFHDYRLDGFLLPHLNFFFLSTFNENSQRLPNHKE